MNVEITLRALARSVVMLQEMASNHELNVIHGHQSSEQIAAILRADIQALEHLRRVVIAWQNENEDVLNTLPENP